MVQQPSSAEFLALQQALEQAQRTVETLRGELRMTQAERDLLKERLNQFKRQLFAAKSEASSQQQRDMFFNEAESLGAQAEPAQEEAEDEDDGIEIAAHKRKRRAGRRPLDAALPREVIRHELPEDQRVCPHDGAELREIGVEASEQLDIIPQQVRVIRHERVKYACPCCDGALRLAAKPAQVIPKGLLSEGAIAWVVVAKYLDGLPLYRQSVLLGRFGGTDLSRSTLSATVVRAGLAVQPVINLMRDYLLESPVVHGDETELQVLKEAGRKAQTKSYMWVQMCEGSGADGTGPPIRLFAYAPGRSTALAQPLYAGMRGGGALMTDGYEPYNAIAQTHGLIHLGCWAHARRYFHDALQALPKDRRGPDQLSARFIDLIGKLYRVEATARERGLGVQERHSLRQRDSVPVLAEIEALLLAQLHGVLPASLLGKALHYLSSQWSKLTRYVEEGRYPIDNNPCENAIRPFVRTRSLCTPSLSV
jgi:transposase